MTDTLTIDGHRLVMQPLNPASSGSPVVLIHGATLSTSFFIPPLVPLFAGERPAYALSLPGHHPAAFPPDFADEQFTASSMTDLLAAALEVVFGAEPVSVMGHSTGGSMAVALAARHPDRIRDAVSVAGFARGVTTGTTRLTQRMAAGPPLTRALFRTTYDLIRQSPRRVYRVWQTTAADPRAYSANPHTGELAQAIHAGMQGLDLHALAIVFRRLAAFDITDWLPQTRVPLLVIAGSADPVVPPEQSRLIAERVPGAQLAVMQGIGHLPFIEDPTAFNQILTDWRA
ncbi:MAG: alpha/beta fold hydrolase [Anaerolineae bacterium]